MPKPHSHSPNIHATSSPPPSPPARNNPQTPPLPLLTQPPATTALMIIKGLFRRYERWNPVHPTAGTFWGMGIGVGCGVGWGPGFGPEVIGYVGAGCGVGFSVGVTLAGVGVGLPINGLLQIPFNAFVTSSGPLELSSSNALMTMRSIVEDSWNCMSPHIKFPKKGTFGRPPSFTFEVPSAENFELDKLNKALTVHIKSTLDSFQAFKDGYRPPWKGS